MLNMIDGKRTKIVATIGPASGNEAVLRKMIQNGLDVARINFSHGTHETHAENISLVLRLAEEEKAVVAIMGDLQGPKIRLGGLTPDPLPIKPGDEIVLTSRPTPDQSKKHLPLPHPEFVKDIRAG
ncbi:partial Pyruvate kinase, partial [Anaerolineae bacterium]